jgi:hypothetical protein
MGTRNIVSRHRGAFQMSREVGDVVPTVDLTESAIRADGGQMRDSSRSSVVCDGIHYEPRSSGSMKSRFLLPYQNRGVSKCFIGRNSGVSAPETISNRKYFAPQIRTKYHPIHEPLCTLQWL